MERNTKQRVYIETTIPSYYHETRVDPEIVVKSRWTREWWDTSGSRYELWTSPIVIEELEQGTYPHKSEALRIVRTLPVLPVNDAVVNVAEAYRDRHVMPKFPVGDAFHLAIASVHHCHFLLTWNCKHLANANKYEHIRHVNTLLGLSVPYLVTPLQLLTGGG